MWETYCPLQLNFPLTIYINLHLRFVLLSTSVKEGFFSVFCCFYFVVVVVVLQWVVVNSETYDTGRSTEYKDLQVLSCGEASTSTPYIPGSEIFVERQGIGGGCKLWQRGRRAVQCSL